MSATGARLRPFGAVLASCAIGAALPAAAQLVALQDRPLSAAERTRMGVLEAQFSRISVQRNTSVAALRTIARALGSKLTALDPDQVLKIVDDRAQELARARGRIQEMQGQLDQLDSVRLVKAVSPLLDAAKQAIDEGRLPEADAQLAQAATRFGEARGTLQAHVDRVAAQEADVLAQQAGVRNALSDFSGAAALFAKAAELSEAKRPPVAWRYRMDQATAIYNDGMDGKIGRVHESLAVLNTAALPLAPRDTRPDDWAATQYRIGSTEIFLATLNGDAAIAERAVAALRSSVAAGSAQTPRDDRILRRTRLGFALGRLSNYADKPAILDEAVALMRDIEATERPESADFYSDYADVFGAFSIARSEAGKPDEAIAAMQASVDAFGKALARIDRTTKARFYLQTQYNLAAQTIRLAKLRSDPRDAARATEIAESGRNAVTRDRNGLIWALFQFAYGQSVVLQNRLQPDVPDDRLDAAVAALIAAEEELAKAKIPAFNRMIRHDRAIGLTVKAHRTRTPDAYATAFAALDAAAQVHPRAGDPAEWADITIRTAALRIDQARDSSGADRRRLLDKAKAALREAAPALAATDRDTQATYAAAVAAVKSAELATD